MKPKPTFAAAHIVTGINGVHEVGEWHEPHGTSQHVAHMDEAAPGIIYHVRLGQSGLQLIRGSVQVCIPLEELLAMAGRVNPKFREPLNGHLTPLQVAETARAAGIVTAPPAH